MNLKNVWTIAKKEFFAYINSPVAFVVLVPFLVINAFLYLRSALMLGDANLRPMIELLPWFMMIIGPALTMRSFAEEKRKDTLELMFAHPVSEWILTVSKFVGIMMFYLLMLALTLPLPISLGMFSSPDVGQLIGQYLGAIFVGSVFISVGIAASALAGSTVGGFLSGLFANFVMMILGMSFVTLLFPGFLGGIITDLAVMSRVTSISRGVIDVRDILYFVSLVLMALTLTVIKLSSRKVAELPSEKRKLQTVFALTVLIFLVGNFLMQEYPLRIDLTNDHRYSISGGSKKLVSTLTDRATITLYYTNNLPGPMQVTLRETQDILRDFKRYGKKVTYKSVDVTNNNDQKQLAIERGIREVQFNQIGAAGFQVQAGMLGLEIRFGDKSEVIDFIDDSSQIEYQLSRLIAKFTSQKEPSIGYFPVGNQTDTLFIQNLQDRFNLVRLTDDSKADQIKDVGGLIVVDDGQTTSATAAAMLSAQLAGGGNALVLADGMMVNAQSLTPTKSDSSLFPILESWGIKIKKDLAYDVQLNESVSLPGTDSRQRVSYIIQYPYWVRSLIAKNVTPIPSSLTNVLLGWPSSIEISNNNEGISVKPFLTTGAKTGGTIETATSIDPKSLKTLPAPSGEKILGVLATKGDQKLMVIGDTDAISDDFWKNSMENQFAFSNLVDYVAADPILSSIPRRGNTRNIFKFNSSLQVQVVQLLNIVLPALISVMFGVYWIVRRNKLTRRTYQIVK